MRFYLVKLFTVQTQTALYWFSYINLLTLTHSLNIRKSGRSATTPPPPAPNTANRFPRNHSHLCWLFSIISNVRTVFRLYFEFGAVETRKPFLERNTESPDPSDFLRLKLIELIRKTRISEFYKSPDYGIQSIGLHRNYRRTECSGRSFVSVRSNIPEHISWISSGFCGIDAFTTKVVIAFHAPPRTF